MTRQEIMAELLKLDVEERIELAEFLWDSARDENLPLTEAQAAEIERRLAEHERDPSTAVPWEIARARLWSRFE
jgi:putative addiction module component (TIGR02574 family)